MAKKITSVTNPTIVEFSKLSTPKVRFLTGLFSVEGEKSLEDILNSYVEIKNIFVNTEIIVCETFAYAIKEHKNPIINSISDTIIRLP